MNQKNIIVTGGTRGLGLAICKTLLKAGYKVISIGRKINPEVELLLKDFPLQFYFESFDFENVKEIRVFVNSILKKHGNIFGLVNNAAIGTDGVLATMHEVDIEKTIKVNITSPIIFTKYVCRNMLINNEGKIINISSIIATTGYNGLTVYGATKAAMVGFTKSLAREMGKVNVTANIISPGYMETDMTMGLVGDKLESILRRSPLGRMAKPEEVANSVLFLLDEKSSSITGTVITVDAGSTA